MEWFGLLVAVSVLLAMTGLFGEAWAAVLAKKRSWATGIAVTCIVAGVFLYFIGGSLTPSGPPGLQQSLQTADFGVLLAAGVSGAVGLVLDRRIGKRLAQKGDADPQTEE